MRGRWVVLLLLALIPGRAVAQGMRVVRVSVVADLGAGRTVPVPGAVVSALGSSRLTDSLGRATLVIGTDGISRPILQARRIGFLPGEAAIPAGAGDTVSVEVRLDRLSLSLPEVRSTATACGSAGVSTAGASLPRIVDQLQQNARTHVTLASDRPFTYELQRVKSDKMVSGREIVTDVDTFSRAPLLDARYRPGGAIAFYVSAMGDYRQAVMKLPELADFADQSFVDAHCFAYAGIETVDGRRLIRVEFEPDSSVQGPDIGGALFLDARTYIIVRTVLELRNIPPALLPEIVGESVTTEFVEAFAGVPIIASVAATTKLPGVRGIGGVVSRSERHTLIRVVK